MAGLVGRFDRARLRPADRLGVFTRIAAILAAGHMAVAYFWKRWPPLDGPPASFWPTVNGGELAVMFCFAFLLLAGMGAGAWSVDAKRGTRVGRATHGRVVPAPRRPRARRRDADC